VIDNPGDILLALGRLEGKVDSLIAQQAKHQTDLDKLDGRLRSLEGSKAALLGICTLIGASASFLVSLLT
jgi:hypothetical protein